MSEQDYPVKLLGLSRQLASFGAALTLVCFSAIGAPPVDSIQVVTEDWKPYSYQEADQVKGLSTDIVRQVLERAGISYKIQVFPWKRTYQTALNGNTVLIYALVRTSQREPLFHWIGQVAPSDDASFYRLSTRNDIQVHSLADARGYIVGTNPGSDKHQFLLKEGFDKLLLVANQTLSLKHLLRGRIDLLITHSINLEPQLSKLGLASNTVTKVYTAFESRPFLAFSRKTPTALVERVRTAYNQLLQEGAIPSYAYKTIRIK